MDNLIFVTFFSLLNLAIFGALILLKCITMGTLCAQLLLQFYTDQLETLQALLSWSLGVHMIFCIIVNSVFVAFFLLLNLAISVRLFVVLCIRSGMVGARILKFYIKQQHEK